MKRFALVFLVLMLVIGINMPEGAISGLGVDTNILLVALVALIIAGLISEYHIGLIVLVLLTAIAANVPREVAASIGYDRDIMLALLIALVLMPIVARQF